MHNDLLTRVERSLTEGSSTAPLERSRNRVSAALTEITEARKLGKRSKKLGVTSAGMAEAIVQQGDKVLADTRFLNASRDLLPGFTLKHIGFGEFVLDGGSRGTIDFVRGAPSFPGASGRSHYVRDDKGGKLVQQLLAAAQDAGLGESFTVSEVSYDDMAPAKRAAFDAKYPGFASGGRGASGGDYMRDPFDRTQQRNLVNAMRSQGHSDAVREFTARPAKNINDLLDRTHGDANFFAKDWAGLFDSAPRHANMNELVTVEGEDEPEAEADPAMAAGNSFPGGINRKNAKSKGTGKGSGPGPQRKKRGSGPKPAPQSGNPGRKGMSNSKSTQGSGPGRRRSKEVGFDKGVARGPKPPQGRGGASTKSKLTPGVPSGQKNEVTSLDQYRADRTPGPDRRDFYTDVLDLTNRTYAKGVISKAEKKAVLNAVRRALKL